MLSLRQVATVAAALFIAGCARAPAADETAAGPCALPASDVEWIESLIAEHEAQVLAGDYDAMLTSFSGEVLVMMPNRPVITGREEVRKFQSEFPPIDEYKLDALDILGCGDFAVARGTYSMSMAIEGAPDPYTDSGKWIQVLRKQPDGTWAIIMDISNSDRPLAGS